MTQYELISDSPETTLAFGRRLGERVRPGDVICLSGPLGAGKTVLAKGISLGAGVPDLRLVTSPTFTLINEYEGRLPVYHVDAYRVRDARELVDVGIEEYFFGKGVTVLEWPERVSDGLPPTRLEIVLAHLAPSRRRLVWRGHGRRGLALAKALAPPGEREV